ncbi:MAG: TerC family protein [Thermoleophilia bacterium]|nr:TerC family protein [Thermoleophilia bacterium]
MNDALQFAVPVWAWLAFGGAIAALLAVDLFLHRDDHEVSFREAAVWSGVWIGAGLAFGVVLWAWRGGEVAATYYSAYLIEKALSVDNVFIFALIFGSFAVPPRLQHRVLFWGVVGALGLRLVFVFVGSGLLQAFFWTAYVLGAFLVFTGYRMAFRHDEPMDPGRNPMVRLVRRVMPVDPAFHDGRFVIRRDGRRVATLLGVTLVAIEASDLVFAVDSVAAVLAITTNTFVVWASIALAVLGLRALYFCLAGLLERFVHLHHGLAFLLAFAGVKLILSETPVGKLPVWLSLSVIAVTLAVSIAWSLLDSRGGVPADEAEVSPPAAAR